MHLKNDPPLTLRGMVPMLASVLLFSANMLLIRALSVHYPAVDGWIASVFRGSIGLLVVFALHGWGRGLQIERLFSSRLIFLRGAIGGLAIILLYITIVKLGAARAVILNLTYPVFACLIAAVWLKEKISRTSMVWMLVGLCGLGVFLSSDGNLLHPSPYDLLALLGAMLAGWVVAIIRKLREDEHHATIFASQALYNLLIAAPAVTTLPILPPTAWGGLIVAAILVAFAQLEMTKAYQVMSVAKGSSIQMLLPVVTSIGGYFWFGESFHSLEILGATLTLFATWRIVAK